MTCCKMMANNKNVECDQHKRPWQCPDALVTGPPTTLRYGLWVHDGGASYIEIRHCPWCGARLDADTQSAVPTRDALAAAFADEPCLVEDGEPRWPSEDEAERMADVALEVLRGGGADAGRIAGLRYVLSLPDEWSSGEVLDAARVWIAANIKKKPQTVAQEPSGQCDVCSAPLYSVCARLDDGGKACSARCVDLARLARAAGVSPDSEDVVGEIEAAIRVWRQPGNDDDETIIAQYADAGNIPNWQGMVADLRAGREPEVINAREARALRRGSRYVVADKDGLPEVGMGVRSGGYMEPPLDDDKRYVVIHRAPAPAPAPLQLGDVVTGDRAVSAPLGTKLGAKKAAVAAVHTTGGWSVTGMNHEQDHEHAVRINEWVVLALGDGGGA